MTLQRYDPDAVGAGLRCARVVLADDRERLK
jgi:hypothetical protein